VTRRRILLGTITSVIALVLCLGIAEGALRLLRYQYTPLRIQVVKQYSDWRHYHAFEDKQFVYDPWLIWRPRPGGDFNSQGYRGPELSATKPAGTYRVFAIADSNTLGWPGKEGANWPMFLSDLLNQGGNHFSVINAAAYGYSSFQGLRRFQESLAFQPDVAIISFGCNDAMRVTVSDAEFASRKIRKLDLDTALLRMHVGQLVLAIADKFASKGKEILVPRVSLGEYKHNLEEMIRLANERQIKIVLLTRPFTGSSPSPNWWKNFAPQYNAATFEVGRQRGVPVIDIHGYFDDKKEYFVDEAHLTQDGLREMARVIYEEIKPLVSAAARSVRTSGERQ